MRKPDILQEALCRSDGFVGLDQRRKILLDKSLVIEKSAMILGLRLLGLVLAR